MGFLVDDLVNNEKADLKYNSHTLGFSYDYCKKL